MIPEELKNKVWGALPLEYKNQVKEIYDQHVKRKVITSQDNMLADLFGRKNIESLKDYSLRMDVRSFYEPLKEEERKNT